MTNRTRDPLEGSWPVKPLAGVRVPSDALGLMEAAQGSRPCDLAVTGARLLNVYTGELLPGQSLCVWKKWIAYAGPDPGPRIGPRTRVLEAHGRTLIPGLIDAHTHMSCLTLPEAVVPHALRHGTTTIITETMEPYPVGGLPAVLDFLDSLKDQPLRFYATAPAMTSISPVFRSILPEDLEHLLGREEILGLGESYWQAVLQQPEIYVPILCQSLQAGKVLEGHAAGAAGGKLAAYTALGISSCHEPIVPEEVLVRLRQGLWCMVREGGIRKDLDALQPLMSLGLDLRRLILVSDSMDPAELLERGYMDHVVQKAIDRGLDPVQAIQAVTLNAAERFGLDRVLGGLGPGRYADFLLIPDLRTIRPQVVVCDGRVALLEGRLEAHARSHRFREESRRSIRLPRPLRAADFRIRASSGAHSVKVRVIHMASPLVTRERIVDLAVQNGQIMADPAGDLLKVAAVDRTHNPGRRAVALIQGFGLRRGALASSAAWDTSDIVAVGGDDTDLAVAVNRVAELQGGAVLCEAGKVVRELPLPILGLMSDHPLEEIAGSVGELKQALESRGVSLPDPLLSLISLTGAAIPFVRICEQGLFSLREGRFVDLFVDP